MKYSYSDIAEWGDDVYNELDCGNPPYDGEPDGPEAVRP